MTIRQLPKFPARIFAGDFEDPLVSAMLGALQADPDTVWVVDWPEGTTLPEMIAHHIAMNGELVSVVIHRRSLGPSELAALGFIRRTIENSLRKPSIELIAGNLVRYSDLQATTSLVDRIVSEGVATEVIVRKTSMAEPAGDFGFPVGILTSNVALREMLEDVLLAFGYCPAVLNGCSDPILPHGSLLIWDVPVLSDRWEVRLRDQSRMRPILTLLGLADRGLIERARSAGAISCLELPFQIEDLRNVLERHATRPANRADMRPDRPRTIRSEPEPMQTDRRFSRDLRHDGGHGSTFAKGVHSVPNVSDSSREGSDRTARGIDRA
jgi:hypothetical protein